MSVDLDSQLGKARRVPSSRMARATMAVAQIADQYGVLRPTVFLRVKKFGLTIPRKGAKMR